MGNYYVIIICILMCFCVQQVLYKIIRDSSNYFTEVSASQFKIKDKLLVLVELLLFLYELYYYQWGNNKIWYRAFLT